MPEVLISIQTHSFSGLIITMASAVTVAQHLFQGRRYYIGSSLAGFMARGYFCWLSVGDRQLEPTTRWRFSIILGIDFLKYEAVCIVVF